MLADMRKPVLLLALLNVQYLLHERQANEGEVKRLKDELAASQKREEVKAQELCALQSVARQIGRRNRAAEVAKAEAEVKLREVQELMDKAKRAAKKSRREAYQWKCRYAAARNNERVPSGGPASPEMVATSSR